MSLGLLVDTGTTMALVRFLHILFVASPTSPFRLPENCYVWLLTYSLLYLLTPVSSSRFKIHDDEIGKDDLAAWACIRLDRLQEGYRFVHFMDAQGVESQGVLLVRVEKSLF